MHRMDGGPLDRWQRHLAGAMGVAANRLGKIVRERRSVTADAALRLWRYFGIDA
jgi:plasmid maintenance system antidote protein VapI